MAGIVIARRLGLQPCGISVEADVRRSERAMQHAADNDVRAELITGTPDQIAEALARPAGEHDMGAAVWALPGTDVDYRGAHLTHHDVQGVEFDLLEPASDVVQQHVRLMMVGTTNRLVEGRLLQYFLARVWGLLVDAPCTAVFTMTHPTLSGFTVRDGNQLWENPFVRA